MAKRSLAKYLPETWTASRELGRVIIQCVGKSLAIATSPAILAVLREHQYRVANSFDA